MGPEPGALMGRRGRKENMYFTTENMSLVNRITVSPFNQVPKTAAAQLSVSIISYKTCFAGIGAYLHFDI